MTTNLSLVAVVTGGAQGIGAATVERLHGAGYRVMVLDVADEEANLLATRLDPSGERVISRGCDVTDRAAVRAAIEAAGALGDVAILVNNVGWSPNRSFVDLDPADWQRIIDVNLTSAMNGCWAVLPGMIERGFGRIVSISSDAARVGTPKETVYAGAKGAVIAFSKSLAAEVARHGITVNVVSPGTTDTPLLRNMLSEDQIARRIAGNPMGRIGRPEDVAGAIAYLVSEDAAYISGQVLSVNGGMSRLG